MTSDLAGAPPVDVPELGEVRRLMLVENLTRTQIVQYAGASGDFNPIHTDEVFATQALGMEGVIAHGMLTMGMTAQIVVDWFGQDRLRTYSARFRVPVRPGDDLVSVATVVNLTRFAGGTDVTLEILTTNQHDQIVLSGAAEVRID